MPRLITTLAVVATLGTVSYAQTCSCGAGPVLYRNSDGDGAPLLWGYEAYQERPSSPTEAQIICYKRHVQNRSANEVRDILWEVAGYKRDFIPAGALRPSCNRYAGEMKLPPDEEGPLFHGVSSSQPYDTAVRPPASGWLKKTAQAAPQDARANQPPLRSDFVLDSRTKDGQVRTSRVSIESLASYDGKVGTFFFSIANEGDGALSILLNIPAIPQMYRDVPVAEKAVFFKPNDKISFKATLESRPEIASGTIVVYGEDGNQAALETAGFYVPVGGRPIRSDVELWKTRPIRSDFEKRR